jgi:hypothetical protein
MHAYTYVNFNNIKSCYFLFSILADLVVFCINITIAIFQSRLRYMTIAYYRQYKTEKHGGYK